MAWLQRKKRGSNFLIQFRFEGRKYTRSLKTSSEARAKARLAKLEETIGFIKKGHVVIPNDCPDVVAFLLNDEQIITAKPIPKRVTLGEATPLT